MQVFLKVKIKELAEEARIIRKEERIAKEHRQTDKLRRLHEHRILVVRRAARSALLAYGYVRGTPYRTIEASARTSPDWKSIRKLISKYGEHEPIDGLEDRVKVWAEA